MEEIILKENNQLQEVNINSLIERYLNYIDVSDNSNKTYYNALKQFMVYLYNKGIKEPTREQIIAYRDELKETLKPNTVNLYLVAIKNFYKWLEYEDITKDITRNVKSLRIGKEHLREALSVEEIKEVLNVCKTDREKLIILLTTSCGIRSNELVNIKIEDFKDKQGVKCLYLLGKGRDYKEDYVIVSNSIFELIQKYIENNNIKDYLFTSKSNHNCNGKLTTTSVRRIVKEMFRKIGLDDEMFSFHSLRHSFATISIQNGSNIREVSQAMRHSSTSITEIYLHDLEKLENKCSNNVSNAIFN